MNLVVDIGNTLIKYAIFDRGEMRLFETSEPKDFLATVKGLFKNHQKINRAIVSSVGDSAQKAFEVLSLFCQVHLLSHQTKTPFKNSYATPHTLGVDRIALATAAFYHNPNGNTLVIDAGTCVTYDMVNDYGEYLGGAISPGLEMRYRAMHEHTARLPLLAPKEILDFIGNTTESSMHSGVVNGMVQEIDGVINQYRKRFKHLTVILTGGDAHFFAKSLKNTIFANPKFLLEGLNHLLEYNKH